MIEIRKHMDLLGYEVEDRVTKFRGVVSSINFDLYGCIQAAVNPGMGKDGKLRESQWFDVIRLKVVSKTRALEMPQYDFTPQSIASGGKGPAEKPRMLKP